MTRKEAIEWFLDHMPVKLIPGAREAYLLAISALRPITREQVEKAWRGEWIEEPRITKSERNRVIHSKKCICSVCKKSNGRNKKNFCPSCGAPMTDDAVEILFNRLGELHND